VLFKTLYFKIMKSRPSSTDDSTIELKATEG
jgi:hypothetical protein